MRIAVISTPFLPVPPIRYGGTELVIWELVNGLRQAGHDTTLYTVGNSRVTGDTWWYFPEALWPPDPYHEQEHAAACMAHVAGGAFDVVHSHVTSILPLAQFVDVPIVHTLHHERVEALSAFYSRQLGRRGIKLVAISQRQRQLHADLDDVEVVWHGLDPSRYPFGPGGESAVFLGRLAREKGPHLALDAAAKAGVRLLIGGEPHWRDQPYFETEVAPRLAATGERAVYLGEVAHDKKVRLLGQALALLFPIQWEEPFGLVMIEAMLAGTPVLAFGRGSAPEIVEEGITGWVCSDVEGMAARLASLRAGHFDRLRCRRRASELFARDRMVRDYLAIYRSAARRGRFELEPAEGID